MLDLSDTGNFDQGQVESSYWVARLKVNIWENWSHELPLEKKQNQFVKSWLKLMYWKKIKHQLFWRITSLHVSYFV